MGLVCAGVLLDGRGGSGAERADVPRVTLWGHDAEQVSQLAQTRRSDRLAGFALGPSVRVSMRDRDALEGSEVIVSAVPAQFARAAWTRLRPYVPEGAAVVSVAKGIENGTLLRPLEVIAQVLGDDPDARPRSMAVLSGPTIAGELARCLPATMVAASDDAAFASRVQGLFTTRWMRIYTSPDVMGVELAGASKNVIAIAAGMLDGLSAGCNAKSALLARGLAEITRLGVALGAGRETFFGIAGAGDLATSCFSPEGRNRSLGEALGRGAKLDEYLAGSAHVVEGVATTRSVVELAQRAKVEMPIAQAVHDVLFSAVDPVDAIATLMTREPKAERVG
jgi:glycerol-3-phosphate dehydrogenase (NAD(P)+)